MKTRIILDFTRNMCRTIGKTANLLGISVNPKFWDFERERLLAKESEYQYLSQSNQLFDANIQII
jgi:hypothetical protein